MAPIFSWLDLLHPFWRRAPLWLRRALIWAGTAKFCVGVSALCLNPRNELLLLEHRFHNEHPWGTPGGWLDRGETPLAGVLREVEEETGLQATVIDTLMVDGDGEWVELYYLCRVPDAEPTIQASEMLGYRWVDPHAVGLNLTPNQERARALLAARLRAEIGHAPGETEKTLPHHS